MTAAEPGASPPLGVAFLDSIPLWGGGQKWCVESARALAQRGHRVWIAAARGGALAERARAAGLDTWTAPLAGPARLVAPLRFARELRRRRAEIVVANAGRDLRMAALATKLSGGSLVQRRGIARAIRGDPLTRWIYAHAVERVIANCAAIRDEMLRGARCIGAERFAILPNGVDLARLAAADGARWRAEQGLARETPLVGCVGRLSAMKGHAHLLRAFAGVRARLPGAVLVLAGEGEEEERLRGLARELGLGESALFLGFVRDPLHLHAALDLFVLPSVRDEGCSNALLESMAQGKPAVVSSTGGLPELVVDGITGRVVPAADERALAQAMVELLLDPELRSRLGSAARARVREHYSLELVTSELEALLAEVRDRKAASGAPAPQPPSSARR